MPNPDDPIVIWLKMLAYAVFAAVAGFLSYTLRQIDAKVKINWCVTTLQGFCAGFVGTLFYLLCMHFEYSGYMTGVVVGLSGWLGADASVQLLKKFVYKKLGISTELIYRDDENANPSEVPDKDSVSK